MGYIEFKRTNNHVVLEEIKRSESKNHIHSIYYLEIRALQHDTDFDINWHSHDVKNLILYGYR